MSGRPGAPAGGAITRWWWVRHAPVPNPEQRCYGQLDKDCDCSDTALFAHQARLLPRNAVWLSSNLKRAIQTAHALKAAGAEMGELVIEPELAEQSFGDLQGLTYVEIGARYDPHHFWLMPPSLRAPNGESFPDLYERATRAVKRITDTHRGRDIVAVAHGGTIRAALGLALNLEVEEAVRFQTENVSVTLIEHFEQAPPAHAWRVVFVNAMPRAL